MSSRSSETTSLTRGALTTRPLRLTRRTTTASLLAARSGFPKCTTARTGCFSTSAWTGLTTGTMTGAWAGDGTLRVNGQAGPVLGGGSTAQLLLGAVTDEGEAWFVLAADHPGVTLQARRPADFSRSLADIQLTEAVIPPGQVLTGLQTARVRDLAATLYAAEAAAVAGYCCRTAAQYARTRHQFGRPIGSFQAIKHLCAGMLCRAERATVLAWDAARAADEAPDEHPLTAAAAAALALDR